MAFTHVEGLTAPNDVLTLYIYTLDRPVKQLSMSAIINKRWVLHVQLTSWKMGSFFRGTNEVEINQFSPDASFLFGFLF